MAMAMTLKQYLDARQVAYDVLTHRPEMSASRVAQACHVPGDCMAKAVMLKDDDGYLMAVVPATRHLRLGELKRMLGRPIGLAREDEAMAMFPDCETGAFPAVGQAYGVKAVCDDSLLAMADVYLEGGDHASVVHMSRDDFGRLMADCPHGQISAHD